MSLSELTDRIRAQNSTVTGIIDRMEREGLVVRERSTEDRRAGTSSLPRKGAPDRARDRGRTDGGLSQLVAGEFVGDRDAGPSQDLTKIAQRVQGIVKREVRGPAAAARKEP